MQLADLFKETAAMKCDAVQENKRTRHLSGYSRYACIQWDSHFGKSSPYLLGSTLIFLTEELELTHTLSKSQADPPTAGVVCATCGYSQHLESVCMKFSDLM